MTVLWIVLAVVSWVGCGVFAYAGTLGTFTSQYSYMKNLPFSIFLGMCGPLGLISILILGNGQYRFRPLTYEERFAEFNKEYSLLGKEYFDQRYK